MKKKYVSYWNQTLQHSCELSFYHCIKKNYSPSAYLDSTLKNPMRRTLVKLTRGCQNLRVQLKQVGTAKSLSMKGYVPSVVVIKFTTKPFLLACQRYFSMRDIIIPFQN